MLYTLHNGFTNNNIFQDISVGENVTLLFEIPGLLFFEDFEKTFDSINHVFIKKAPSNFVFEIVIKLTKTDASKQYAIVCLFVCLFTDGQFLG